MQHAIPRPGIVAPVALLFVAAACSSTATADPDGVSTPDEDYPDPVTDIDGGLQRLGRRALNEIGIDPRSEEFIEARTTCADEVGFAGGFGGRGGSR